MDTYLELGMGGALAIFIVREVLGFLSKRNGKNNGANAGGQSTEFWQVQMREITEKAVSDKLAPFLSSQTEILRAIQTGQAEMNKAVNELLFIAKRLERQMDNQKT